MLRLHFTLIFVTKLNVCSALKILTSICKKTCMHSKNEKAMEIMFCECNENQGAEVQCEICHFTIKLKISSCANVVYNDIVDKNFRLCRCRTLKSSCTNVVKVRLRECSIQSYPCKNIRLCRCKTLKSSFTNVVRIKLRNCSVE